MTSISKHIQRHPHARPSTLAFIELHNKRLEEMGHFKRLASRQKQDTPKKRLAAIFQKINELIGRV